MTHLVFGGSASGKSLFAEGLSMQFHSPRIYLATMQPWDEECLKRIEKHRKQRETKGFDTLECYGSLVDITSIKNTTILLECVGNLVANLQFAENPPPDIVEDVCQNLDTLVKNGNNLIVVTNDVFLEEPPKNQETEAYLNLLGEVNRQLAAKFDRLTEVVCGIPVQLKGGL